LDILHFTYFCLSTYYQRFTKFPYKGQNLPNTPFEYLFRYLFSILNTTESKDSRRLENE